MRTSGVSAVWGIQGKPERPACVCCLRGAGTAPWCHARLPMKPPSVFLPVCTSENSLLAVPTKSRSTRGQFLHENRKPGPCSPRTPD